MLPCQIGIDLGSVGIANGIAAYCITGDRTVSVALSFIYNGFTGSFRKKVCPIRVVVGISLGCGGFTAIGIGYGFALGTDVSGSIISIAVA